MSKLGPLMLGVDGLVLTAEERERLLHPTVGGVVLFTRNFESPVQLKALTAEIKAVRDLVIAVDHEGGRVQRFKQGFTRIPPMRALGNLWQEDAAAARDRAHDVGLVIATELIAHGIDFSFGPVLDIDHGNSSVIGHRAFHDHAEVVTELALALQAGAHAAGMATVGKHFPGHGFAKADSHVALPTDDREYSQIREQDMQPFARLIQAGMDAVMPAHVVYPAVDKLGAGFSKRWLQEILRGELGFQGAIISDDLGMEGAAVMGDMCARADACIAAGADVILSCNDPVASAELLAHLRPGGGESAARIAGLRAGTAQAAATGEYSRAALRVAALARVALPEEALPAIEDIVARL